MIRSVVGCSRPVEVLRPRDDDVTLPAPGGLGKRLRIAIILFDPRCGRGRHTVQLHSMVPGTLEVPTILLIPVSGRTTILKESLRR